MERDALIIRNLALGLVKQLDDLPCSYDMGEQIQRAATALHMFFSEVFDVAGSRETDALVENALKITLEFRSLIKSNGNCAVSAKKIELLVFTLRTYRSVDGKFRKFARHNTGGINL